MNQYYLPIIVAFLAAATWRNTTNSTIVAVGACVVGSVRLLTQTRFSMKATGAVVFSDCSSEAGKYAATELSRYSVRDADKMDSVSREMMYPFLLNTSDSSSIKKTETDHQQAYKDVKGELARRNLELVGLVTSASVSGKVGPADELDGSDYREVLEEGFIGPTRLIKKFLPLIRSSGGRIVHLGSVLGFISPPLAQPYSAAHHAMESFLDTLRRELKHNSISVSIIRLGWFQGAQQDIADKGPIADFFEAHKTPKWAQKYSALYGKGRRVVEAARATENLSRFDELAKTVTHAVSDELPQTRYVVGSVVDPRLGAVPAVFLRWMRYVLGDRAMDAAITWV